MKVQQVTRVLNEIQSRRILGKYQLNQNKYLFAKNIETCIEVTNQLKYPLVMKVVSDKIVHKSDFGGVQIGLNNLEDVKNAYNIIIRNALLKNVKEDEIDGVSIQEMENGLEEILIGVKKDPVFGPVILVGLGGVLVELMKDVSLGICPLDDDDIYKMLKKLKGYPLLNGYRGKKQADIAALVETVKKVQELVLNEPDILEMDLNPVMVKEQGKGCMIVDARIVMKN
ncbi:acetate--CoA ligase family protein [Neobacillus niacini]|uniref:acetate--CoA ligase family protein n=1 Tax=Neobacillus niacini TaxID=86668 RepID=UPI003000C2CF